MYTTELLESERNTAFYHSLWSRYQWLELLEYSKLLQELHTKYYGESGYSPIQDSFYAVQEQQPNSSPAGQVWSKIMADPKFSQIADMVKDKPSRINVMRFLSKKYYELLEELEEQQEQEKGDEKEQNQPPTPDFDPYDNDDDDDDDIDDEDEGDEEENNQENEETAIQEMRKILSQESSEDAQVDPNPQAGPSTLEATSEEIADLNLSISDQEINELRDQIEGEEVLHGLTAGLGMSPIEQREFVEMAYNKYNLRKLAKLVGWANQVMGGAVRANKGAIGEYTEITQRSWNSRVTQMDMHLVSSGNLLGKAKMAEGKLNTKVHKEERPAGKGSVVFLHDESGSMRGDYRSFVIEQKRPEDRTPDEQAYLDSSPNKDLQVINLQLSMAHLFRKENRPFSAIAWNDGATRVYKYGKPGLQDHLDKFLGGGTEINHALHRALNLIETDPQHRNNADIIIASDGDTADLPNQDHTLMKKLATYQERGGRIWGIFIGDSRIHRERMATYCDFVVNIDDLYISDKLGEILRRASTNNQKHKRRLI